MISLAASLARPMVIESVNEAIFRSGIPLCFTPNISPGPLILKSISDNLKPLECLTMA